MGLYDREYYRDDYSRRVFWQSGAVTMSLVVITVAVFLLQLISLTTQDPDDVPRFTTVDPILKWCGFSHEKILNGEVWRLFTSLFVHHTREGLWFLVAGLVVLAYCGRSVEGTYGAKEMFWFYVFTGLLTQLALFAVCLVQPFHFQPPRDPFGTCGGPVAAVMVLFAVMSPNSTVPLIFTSPRASTLAIIIVAGNLLLFFGTVATPRPHYAAIPVLVGAAFAFAYYEYGWRVSNWIPDLPGLRRDARAGTKKSRSLFRDDPELDTPSHPIRPTSSLRQSERSSSPTPPSVAVVDEQLESQVDRVLAKMSQFGKSSLTDEENAILQRASEVYKNRRK